MIALRSVATLLVSNQQEVGLLKNNVLCNSQCHSNLIVVINGNYYN